MAVGDDYLSVTVTSASNAIGVRFDPFDEDNHGTFTKIDNVTASGITFDQTTGRFTVDNAATYLIDVLLMVSTSSSQSSPFEIEVNGVVRYTTTMIVHTAVDPTPISVAIELTLAATDYINVFIDPDGNCNRISEPGTTMTIVRIT